MQQPSRTARSVWALAALAAAVELATVGGIAPSAAQEHDGDTDGAHCLAAIAHANADLTSFTARIHQTKILALLEEPLESSGRLTFQRPDRIAWQLDGPPPLRVIVDGDRISIPGMATDDEAAAAIGPAALVRRLGALFTGNLDALSDAFDVTVTCREDAADVTLFPRTPEIEMAVSSLELELAGPELLVQSIRMSNGVGDRLELRLHDIERNPTIPDSAFSTDGDAR